MMATWSQLPTRTSTAGSKPTRSTLTAFALTWLLVAPIPAAGAANLHGTPAFFGTLAITALGAALAVALAKPAKWFVPPAILVLDGWVVVLAYGRIAGVVTAIAGLIACWAILDRRPAFVRPVGAHALAPLFGMTLLGALIAARFGRYWSLPAVGAVGLVAVLAAYAPSATSRLAGAVERGAAWVARLIVAILMALLGLVLVLVPWAVQRIFRWDPTWVPRRPGSRWVPVNAGTADSHRMWDPDPRVRRTTPGRRFHRFALVLSCLVAVAVLFGVSLYVNQRQIEDDLYDAPALADSPWWPAMHSAMDMAFGRSPISAYAGVLPVDASAPDFHVVDGRRQTWRPPVSGDCIPLRVWMFGGSSLFGMGQRDDHTIASELAQIAWDEGVALEIDNFGVPGDTYWMEGRRLQLALAEGELPPDHAIFYDGPNDWRVQAQLNADKRGGQLLFANDLDWQALPSLQRRNERLAALLAITRDAPEIDKQPELQLPPEGIGSYAAEGYAAAGELLRPVLDAANINSTHFYQPSRVSRNPKRDTEEPDNPDNEAYQATIEAAFRQNLPDDVIDLSGAMDRSDEPVYWDEVHTNELGARLVAEAMWEELGPKLVALAADEGTGTCA